MSKSPSIVVVGSINMDLLVRTERMPLPGQTLPGQALAVSLVRGRDLRTAARHANAAAALTCTQFGAQPALPHEQQWVRLIHRGIID